MERPLSYYSDTAKLNRAINAGHIVIKDGKYVITEAGKAWAKDNPMGIGAADRIGPIKNGKPVNAGPTPFNELNPSASRLKMLSKQKPPVVTPKPVAPSVPASSIFGNFKMVPVSVGGVMRVVKAAARPLAGIGLAADFYDNATGLVSSLQRGEGFAAIPGIVQDIFDGDEEEEVVEQTQVSSNEPKDVVQPRKRELPNIQASEEVSAPVERVTPPVVRKSMNISKPQAVAKPAYDPANDPRNAEYIAARNKLNSNSSAADIQAVEDIGMATWESIYGNQ